MTPYTEDCISITGVFEEPIGYPMYTQPTLMPLLIHEAATGMKPEETAKKLFERGNYLYLQRDFARKLEEKIFARGMALVPPDEIIQCITDMYNHNLQCPIEERVSLKIPPGNSLEYRLKVAGSRYRKQPPVYLRHPLTGVVTRHQYPYPAMPPIRLRTADPLLVVLRARTLLSERGSAVKGPALEALACATGNYLGSVSFERHPPVPIPPLLAVPSACQQKPSALICTKRNINRARGSLTTSATSNAKPLLSSKRQRSALPAESPSSKRSRRVRPSIPVRRNPPRAAKSKTVCLPHARGPR